MRVIRTNWKDSSKQMKSKTSRGRGGRGARSIYEKLFFPKSLNIIQQLQINNGTDRQGITFNLGGQQSLQLAKLPLSFRMARQHFFKEDQDS